MANFVRLGVMVGKAQVVSHIGDAKYSVIILKNLDSVSFQLSRMITRYQEVQPVITEAEQRMGEIEVELNALQAEAEPLSEQFLSARASWLELKASEPKKSDYQDTEMYQAASDAWNGQITALREAMDEIMEAFVEITKASLELQKEYGLLKTRRDHARLDLLTIQRKIDEF